MDVRIREGEASPGRGECNGPGGRPKTRDARCSVYSWTKIIRSDDAAMNVLILATGPRSSDGQAGSSRGRSIGSTRPSPGSPTRHWRASRSRATWIDALARQGIDTVILGGPIEQRGEVLRRSAAEGFAIICLHPPGPTPRPTYQVALSRAETGAVIVPDLPLRLHPGVAALRPAASTGELGAFAA